MTTISGKRILVTGAHGLLGQQVVSRLAEVNTVWGLVRAMPSDPIPGVRYIAIDLSFPWDIRILPEHLDAIVHLAQSRHFRNFPEQALEIFQVNLASTAQLLDFAWRINAERFIYASSGGIYHHSEQELEEGFELRKPDTLGYYLSTKLSCEALALSYAHFMTIMNLRFFFIYGRRQSRSMLIPRLIDNIRCGRPISLQGETGPALNPIHVDDAASAVVAALQCPNGGTYNIAGPQVLTLRDLCREIGQILGEQPLFESVPGNPPNLVGDISKMKTFLHVPTVRVSDGLRDLI